MSVKSHQYRQLLFLLLLSSALFACTGPEYETREYLHVNPDGHEAFSEHPLAPDGHYVAIITGVVNFDNYVEVGDNIHLHGDAEFLNDRWDNFTRWHRNVLFSVPAALVESDRGTHTYRYNLDGNGNHLVVRFDRDPSFYWDSDSSQLRIELYRVDVASGFAETMRAEFAEFWPRIILSTLGGIVVLGAALFGGVRYAVVLDERRERRRRDEEERPLREAEARRLKEQAQREAKQRRRRQHAEHVKDVLVSVARRDRLRQARRDAARRRGYAKATTVTYEQPRPVEGEWLPAQPAPAEPARVENQDDAFKARARKLELEYPNPDYENPEWLDKYARVHQGRALDPHEAHADRTKISAVSR